MYLPELVMIRLKEKVKLRESEVVIKYLTQREDTKMKINFPQDYCNSRPNQIKGNIFNKNNNLEINESIFLLLRTYMFLQSQLIKK